MVSTSTSKFLLSLGLAASAATAAPSQHYIPEGFVTTSGTEFQLDGESFHFAGSNAYYFPFDNVCFRPLPLAPRVGKNRID